MDRSLMPRPADCSVPLTALQLELWRSVMSSGKRLSSRLTVTSVRILGPLDTMLLRECLNLLVQRHETLRTRIVSVDGTPRQHIDVHHECSFELIDLSRTPAAEAEAQRIVQEFIDARVDWSAGPLFDVKLLQLSSSEHILAIGIDHIVADAASCQILNRELWTLYSQGTQGQSLLLPTLAVQFADYAVWQDRAYEEWVRDHEPYWREHLAGAPSITIPSDSGLEEMDYSTASAHFPLGKQLTARLRELAANQQTRLPSVVLTIYMSMMSRWLNQRDLVIAFISHGRHLRPELKTMVGFLANHMILRLGVDENESFVSLLNRVDRELACAYRHYDFGWLRRLFPQQVSELGFNWVSISSAATSERECEARRLPVTVRAFPVRTAWDVSFCPFFSETASGINTTLVYRIDRHAKATVERFGRELRSFAGQCGHHPFAGVGSVVSG